MKRIFILSSGALGNTSPTVIPTANLLSYYDFNYNTLDIKGGNHLNPFNTVTSFPVTLGLPSKSGSAAQFTGENTNGLKTQYTGAFAFGNGTTDSPFSISTFVYNNLTTTTLGIIAAKIGATTPAGEWFLRHASGNLIFRLYSQDSDVNNIQAFIAEDLTSVVNTWSHLVATYDGSGTPAGLKLYRDGVLLVTSNSETGTYVAMSDTDIGTYLGDDVSGSGFNLDGTLDGLGIWDKELTQAEITLIYNTQNAGDELFSFNLTTIPTANILSYYGFDSNGFDWKGSNDFSQEVGGEDVIFTEDGIRDRSARGSSVDGTDITLPASTFTFTDGATDDPFSVSFAFNQRVSTNDVGWFISKRDGTDREWEILYNGGVIVLLVSDTTGTNSIRARLVVTYGFYVNYWTHLTFTYDGSGLHTGLKIYQDGVLRMTDSYETGTFTSMGIAGTKVYAMGSGWSATRSVDANLDMLAVWDKALSAQESHDIFDYYVKATDLIANPIPMDNLLSYYPFDTVSTLNDTRGTNHFIQDDGGGNNVIFTDAGKSGEAATGDGVRWTGLEQVSTNFTFGDGATDVPFSISFYIYFNATLTDQGWFVSKRNGTDSEYQIYHFGGDLVFILNEDLAGNNLTATITQALVLETWYHITCTYDGTGNASGLKIYLDNTLLVTTNVENGTYVAMSQGTADFRAISQAVSSSYTMNGRMDGLGIWDKELTATEVTNIYDKQNAGKELA